MSELVRYFTCAGVIALGGLTATSSMLACSSSSTTVTEGDDDDDDDGKSTTSSSSSSSTSSSSSSSSSGAAPVCEPVGTWSLAKPQYVVTTPGKVCDDFAASGNQGGKATEVTITKDGSGYKAVSEGATLVLAAADEVCQIGGGIPPIGLDAKDADGKDIVAKLTPTQFYDFEGDKIVSKVNYTIESDPPGAKGTPCAMQQLQGGIRKKP